MFFLFISKFDQLVNIVFTNMHADSVSSSHPISVEVNNPDEINEIFDGITYGKVIQQTKRLSIIIKKLYFKLSNEGSICHPHDELFSRRRHIYARTNRKKRAPNICIFVISVNTALRIY